MAQRIPLDNSPNQTFQITVLVDGQQITLNLGLRFNEVAGYWTMDIADQQNVPMLVGIPCLTGSWPAANILGQYGYLGIGSAYFVNVSNLPQDFPDKASLGTGFVLIWDDTAA